jgi:hypothetical protein
MRSERLHHRVVEVKPIEFSGLDPSVYELFLGCFLKEISPLSVMIKGLISSLKRKNYSHLRLLT